MYNLSNTRLAACIVAVLAHQTGAIETALLGNMSSSWNQFVNPLRNIQFKNPFRGAGRKLLNAVGLKYDSNSSNDQSSSEQPANTETKSTLQKSVSEWLTPKQPDNNALYSENIAKVFKAALNAPGQMSKAKKAEGGLVNYLTPSIGVPLGWIRQVESNGEPSYYNTITQEKQTKYPTDDAFVYGSDISEKGFRIHRDLSGWQLKKPYFGSHYYHHRASGWKCLKDEKNAYVHADVGSQAAFPVDAGRVFSKEWIYVKEKCQETVRSFGNQKAQDSTQMTQDYLDPTNKKRMSEYYYNALLSDGLKLINFSETITYAKHWKQNMDLCVSNVEEFLKELQERNRLSNAEKREDASKKDERKAEKTCKDTIKNFGEQMITKAANKFEEIHTPNLSPAFVIICAPKRIENMALYQWNACNRSKWAILYGNSDDYMAISELQIQKSVYGDKLIKFSKTITYAKHKKHGMDLCVSDVEEFLKGLRESESFGKKLAFPKPSECKNAEVLGRWYENKRKLSECNNASALGERYHDI